MMPKRADDEDVLAFIQRFIAEHQYPPSRRQIQDHFGWSGPSGAQLAVKRLQQRGWIEVDAGTTRGMRVMKAAPVPMTEEI